MRVKRITGGRRYSRRKVSREASCVGLFVGVEIQVESQEGPEVIVVENGRPRERGRCRHAS